MMQGHKLVSKANFVSSSSYVSFEWKVVQHVLLELSAQTRRFQCGFQPAPLYRFVSPIGIWTSAGAVGACGGACGDKHRFRNGAIAFVRGAGVPGNPGVTFKLYRRDAVSVFSGDVVGGVGDAYQRSQCVASQVEIQSKV